MISRISFTVTIVFVSLFSAFFAIAAPTQFFPHRVEINRLRGASRIALVVGNQAYENTTLWPALRLSSNDAEAVAEKLQTYGFELVGGRAQIDVKIADFNKLSSQLIAGIRHHPGAIVVIYYSGHGFSRDKQNLLVPIDAASDKMSQAVALRTLTRQVVAAGAGLDLVFIDACRESPEGDLTDERVSKKTFIGYSTLFGSFSAEGLNDQNSFYTKALINEFGRDWERPEDLQERVADDVIRETQTRGGPVQTPVYRSGWGDEIVSVGRLLRREVSEETEGHTNDSSNDSRFAQGCRAEALNGRIISQAIMLKMETGSSILSIGGSSEDARSRVASAFEACANAVKTGSHDQKTLVAYAFSTLAASFINIDTSFDGDRTRVATYLTEAAEEGNPYANFGISILQAGYGFSDHAEDEVSVATDRLIRAGESGDPFLATFVGLFVSNVGEFSVPGGLSLRKDAAAGSRLILKAAASGSVFATQLIIYSRQKNRFGLQIPDDIDIRKMMDRTIHMPTLLFGSREGEKITPLQSLIGMAVEDALGGQFGEVDMNRFIKYTKISEPFLARFISYQGNNGYVVAQTAGCLLSGRIISSQSALKIKRDTTLARRLFLIAKQAGSDQADFLISQLDATGETPCTMDIDKLRYLKSQSPGSN